MCASTDAAISSDLGSADLAELLASVNQVTSRLEQTHGRLREEVATLQAELRAANEELERSRRLAALGEMAAGIAHEVRNPLGSIALYARMLRSDLGDSGEQAALADRIVTAVRGLDAIVNDVLVFSRELRTSPVAIQATQLTDEAIARCADLLSGDASPELSIFIDPSESLPVQVDRALFVQALTNVLRNGIEAAVEQSPTGGGRVALFVRTSAEVAGSGRDAPMVVFRVEDSGPGISDEALGRMFNPFFTTRAAGTGLGLPIVHRIMEAHGGRVLAAKTSALGGAAFELWVPLASDLPEITIPAATLTKEAA